MVLYTETGEPATESDILSAYGRIMNARVKGKRGPKPALDARQRRRAIAMLAKGERQVDIAERLGVTQSTISKLKNEGVRI